MIKKFMIVAAFCFLPCLDARAEKEEATLTKNKCTEVARSRLRQELSNLTGKFYENNANLIVKYKNFLDRGKAQKQLNSKKNEDNEDDGEDPTLANQLKAARKALADYRSQTSPSRRKDEKDRFIQSVEDYMVRVESYRRPFAQKLSGLAQRLGLLVSNPLCEKGFYYQKPKDVSIDDPMNIDAALGDCVDKKGNAKKPFQYTAMQFNSGGRYSPPSDHSNFDQNLVEHMKIKACTVVNGAAVIAGSKKNIKDLKICSELDLSPEPVPDLDPDKPFYEPAEISRAQKEAKPSKLDLTEGFIDHKTIDNLILERLSQKCKDSIESPAQVVETGGHGAPSAPKHQGNGGGGSNIRAR